MRLPTRRPTRLRNAATLLLSAVILSGAALYNGYPLVYPDTGGYLLVHNYPLRSIFYSLFVAPARLTGTLWTVIFAQALLTAYLLRLVLREVFAIASRVGFLIIIALLSALTSLPWCAGYLMPDIFTPVMVLGLFMLAFCPERLSRWERCYVIALTFVAAIVHYSHLPIAIGLMLVGLMFRVVLRRRAPNAGPHLMIPAFVIAAGVVAIVISNYLTLGLVTFSPAGYAFELARLVADGPAVEYLRENCATRKYAACAYLNRMPMDSVEFIFSNDGLFKTVGFLAERKEGQEIIAGTIERYPLWVLRNAVADTLSQIGRGQTGDDLGSLLDNLYPTVALRSHYPADFPAYANSRQGRGELRHLRGIQRLDWNFAILSAVYCSLIAILLARDGQWLPVELLITVGFAVLVNAFVAGAISNPSNRYGSRIIWMLPLVAIASWRRALGLPDADRARNPDASRRA